MKTPALLLCFFSLVVGSLCAQSEDQIKHAVDEALRTHLSGITPANTCDCNSCTMNYADAFRITDSRRYEDKLLLVGKAKMNYTSRFQGAGETPVEFHVEVQRLDGAFVVTKVKWRANNCMSLETRFEL